MTRPVLLIIGGPNGSGKTTITSRLRRDHWSDGVEYLNPDEIAQQRFGGWNDPAAILAAAGFAEQRRESLLAARLGIAFETVFSAPDKLAFVRKAKDAGYFVRLFFVSTGDPCINAARVARRVMDGGHTVPIEKIIARYARSHANLEAAIPLLDRVYLFDNAAEGRDAVLCARISDGKLRKLYAPTPPDWVRDTILPLERDPGLQPLLP